MKKSPEDFVGEKRKKSPVDGVGEKRRNQLQMAWEKEKDKITCKWRGRKKNDIYTYNNNINNNNNHLQLAWEGRRKLPATEAVSFCSQETEDARLMPRPAGVVQIDQDMLRYVKMKCWRGYDWLGYVY